jgi:hypothetical protein
MGKKTPPGSLNGRICESKGRSGRFGAKWLDPPMIQEYPVVDTVELQLPGLTGTANHPDMQKFRIIEFFFENRPHWQF